MAAPRFLVQPSLSSCFRGGASASAALIPHSPAWCSSCSSCSSSNSFGFNSLSSVFPRASISAGTLRAATSVPVTDETLGSDVSASTLPQTDRVRDFEDPSTDPFSADWWEKRTGERPPSQIQTHQRGAESRNALTRSGSNNEENFRARGGSVRSTATRGNWNRGGDVANDLIREIKMAKDERDLVANVLKNWSQPLSSRNIVSIINNVDTWRKAYAFFEWLKAEDRYEINKFVYNVLLKTLRRGKQWKLCEKVAEDMIADGVELDNFTYSILISCAKRCSMTAMALKWFDKMNEAGCVPDEVTYCTMIDVYGAAGMTEEALELYDRLRKRGWNPDQVTFGTMTNVYAKMGDHKSIERLIRDMKELGAQPNAVVYNTYMLALIKAGKLSLVSNVLSQMEDAGIKPTSVTLSILIEMHSKLGAVDDALNISRKMQQEGLVFDNIVYNSLISACSENSMLKEAEDVLAEMKEAGFTPDEATYRCMISVYATTGMVDKARELLDKFLEDGYKPTVQVYSSMIRACKQAQQYDKVPSYFEEMIMRGCKPDQRFCGILLACLSTCEDQTLREGILNCLQWISLTLHDIAKSLLTKDADGPWLQEQIKMAFEEMHENSYLPFCNTLIDMCMNLGYVEGSHQILGIGVMLGVYKNIQVRSELEWRLDLRGLSLSAAQCAVEGWMTSLKMSLQEGELLPLHFVIETGVGSRRVSDQRKLSEIIPALLKKLDAPFQDDLEAGAFVATASALRSWLESRQVSHSLTL